MTRKIIIDTDPGQDDAVAILLALASPEELDVLGIVAVAGNVGLAQNAKNALKIVELSGRHRHSGLCRLRAADAAEAGHRRARPRPTGLDGPDLPEPKIKLEAKHGVDFIIDTLRAEPPGTVTLCTLGPLTNIAMALVKAPDIAPRIREIVMMGGAYFEVGNITPAAEFNVYVDPEAADVVLHERHPDHHDAARRHPRRAQPCAPPRRLSRLGNKAGDAVADMLAFSERFDLEKYGSERRAAPRPLRHRLAAQARRCSMAARSTSPSRRRAS